LLEVGDSLRPLLKFSILRLDVVLEMHDCVGTGIYLLTGEVNLLMGVVHPMLGLAKEAVRDLLSYPVFTPKPSTHRMHDPGSIVPHIRPKVLTDNQIS
jgi:hypothetical protein